MRFRQHIDPFAADTPLYTITAQNKAQYAARLSAGQNAMFARHPETYRIDVYPTRRACGLPQAVYDETKKNVTRAKLTQDGNKVVGARIGVPFPIPQNALIRPTRLINLRLVKGGWKLY